MRAARFHAWGVLPTVDEVAEPAARDGYVTVRMTAAALSHLDLTVAGGTWHPHPELPYIGGVEGCGVTESGTQVLVRGGGLGLVRDGTWAELVHVAPKALTPVPADVPAEVAATFFQPASTAYVAVHDIGRAGRDDVVIVVGAAGAVGGQAVQQALRAGATVTGVVRRSEDLDRIPAGAGRIALADPDAVTALTTERPASLLIDTVGGPDTVGRSRWVAPGGRAVVLGYTAGPTVTVDLPSWLLDDVALVPVNMIRLGRRARELEAELTTALLAGELTVAVETFPLEAIGTGLERLRAGTLHGRGAVLL
ncbi:MAG TPA: zinc-binding alcohol dehydrogenase family protein [Pseudonocardiaceae bacterium]|nr:zinc-binding alcohol dehydrogenase family protein [Pseudonocardiaceae bacterium]